MTANRQKAPKLRDLTGLIDALVRDFLDPYRPEQHYMRGPGPKWHAKHAPSFAEAPSLQGLQANA